MKNSLKKLILAVVLSILANVPNSYAQNVNVNEITDFKLSTVEDSSNSVIVPDKAGRLEVIRAIQDLSDDLFADDVTLQRAMLISKILVLDDIMKDFLIWQIN